MANIGLWFYRNEGGQGVLDQFIDMLRALGHDVFDQFDLRECYVKSGHVYTKEGRNLSELDLLYHMNADEQSPHQKDILRAIELSGVKVINSYGAYDRCQDKFVTNMILRRHGIKVPPAGLFPTKTPTRFLTDLVKEFGTVVVKKRKGYGGQGIMKFSSASDLADFVETISEFSHSFYFEKFVEFGDKDYRVDLIDQEYVGGYRRKRNHPFKTNVHKGAAMVAEVPGPVQIDVAKRAARALDIDVTIVDMVVGVDDGETYVLEVAEILGVFTGAGLKAGVNTIQRPEDAHPIFAYDDRKLELLSAFLDRQARKRLDDR